MNFNKLHYDINNIGKIYFMYFTKSSLMTFSKVNIKLEYLICGEEIM